MHGITVSYPCTMSRFLGALDEIRRDLVSFPENFFFNLSFFTLGKMRETRPPVPTAVA